MKRIASEIAALLLVAGCGGRLFLEGGDGGAYPDGDESESGISGLDSSGGGSADIVSRDSDSGPIETGGAGPAASCAPGGPGMTNCGANSESCCTSLEVTGGTYFRTYTYWSDMGPSSEANPATVSSFRLDKYEVTVGRFRQFVGARESGYSPPPGSGKHIHLNGGMGLANSANPGTYEPGWVASDNARIAPTATNMACSSGYEGVNGGTWTATPGPNENRPIDCVNWWESFAFCIWDGGFLPSEAEWGYAAAGGDAQREYPWGDTDPGTANQYAIYNCNYPTPSGTCMDGVLSLAPVGTPTLGASLWGQFDLAGNSFERTADLYAPYVDACLDCAWLTRLGQGSPSRVLRGGGVFDPTSYLQASDRDGNAPPGPGLRAYALGFRCARVP